MRVQKFCIFNFETPRPNESEQQSQRWPKVTTKKLEKTAQTKRSNFKKTKMSWPKVCKKSLKSCGHLRCINLVFSSFSLRFVGVRGFKIKSAKLLDNHRCLSKSIYKFCETPRPNESKRKGGKGQINAPQMTATF